MTQQEHNAQLRSAFRESFFSALKSIWTDAFALAELEEKAWQSSNSKLLYHKEDGNDNSTSTNQ